jgi:hypothetical protein
MNGKVSVNPPRGHAATVLWVMSGVMFGLLGPGFLTLLYGGLFRRASSLEYPWAFPYWSYGITVIKCSALLAWIWLQPSPRRYGTLLAGVFAGVFLVGGAHALACAILHSSLLWARHFEAWYVVVAYLSALVYLANFLFALFWGEGSTKRLLVGVLLGLLLVVGLPGALELYAR